ncbi:uncharacterized protein [Henckelia pumila]|uniref:uncharacterized protein n=1 Tax=Henckelia pumila TaxID=405737 RepID=UPI003C6E20B8
MAANANLSLRQLDTHDPNQQPLCITFSTPENNATFELKSGLIDLLPSFHGLAGNGQNVKVCGICTARGHATDMCPTLQEGSTEQVNAGGGFPGPPQRKYDPYSNTYNPGWKDHPNLIYGNPAMNQPAFQVEPNNQAYRPPYPPPQSPQIPTPGEFLENIVKDLATNTLNFQQEMRESIQHLNTQVGQLATAINKLEAQSSSSLPSQRMVNPKDNVSANTLRSGKELKVNEEAVQTTAKKEEVEESKLDETSQKDTPRGMFPPLSEYKPVAPLPLALKESRKDESIKGLYETFRCEKQKLKGCRRVELGEQVSAVIQRKIPTKCKDPGMFSIRCKIGDIQLDTAMLDLGALINVMPYSVYASLKLGPLNETTIFVQMADKSTIFPRGVIEDVLVQVGKLIFPTDFYVLDMKNNDLNNPILLGRPFLKTSKSIIDVNNGTLTMEFDGKIIEFNIFDSLKTPGEKHKEVVNKDGLKKVMAQHAKNSVAEIFNFELQVPKIETKLSPDREKGMPKEKRRNRPEMGIPKKRKHRKKIIAKLFKWVKVDKGARYEPP